LPLLKFQPSYIHQIIDKYYKLRRLLVFAFSCSHYLSSQLLFLLRPCCNDTSPVTHEYLIVLTRADSTFSILQIRYESTQGYATSNQPVPWPCRRVECNAIFRSFVLHTRGCASSWQ